MTDADLERRLEQLRLTEMRPTGTPSGTSGRSIDIARAWREFLLLRSRSNRNRRRGLMAAAVVAAAGIAITVPALAGIRPSATGPKGPGTETISASLGASPGPSPRVYAGAVVARIPLSGVGTVVQDGARAWAIRDLSMTHSGLFATQLVSIDMRTDRVVLRKNLGTAQSTVAAGGGRVWLTTSLGQSQGQIVRIDSATGRAIATLHLPAGRCYFATYSSGSLWATCANGSAQTVFLRIDPATGHVLNRAGPVPGQVRSITVGRDAVWYASAGWGITGVVGIGGPERVVTVHDPTNTVRFFYTNSLVSGQGYVWALTTDESVAKIDPATGQVLRIYTYRSYDPGYAGGLDFLAVGHGSLWFLVDRYPLSGVLRVNISTGKSVGQVGSIASRSCGEPCWQIYATQSAIWVPTQDRLIRIDLAKSSG